jgi:large subunit ribosomal protein L25
MSTRQFVKLAESLPPRLTRFFARYPPPAILPSGTNNPPSSAAPNPSQTDATSSVDQITSGIDGLSFPSPFKCHKHPVTGKWHDPVFSLRRQAELVKLARQHGVEELLPFTVKGTQERIRRRTENGLRVKGTGIGQHVKGKERERTMKTRYVLGNLGSRVQSWLGLGRENMLTMLV